MASIISFLSNKCPQCHEGPIYGSFIKMNKNCTSCGYVYEREPGYFTGAMFLDTIFLPVSAIPTVLLFAYKEEIYLGGVVAVGQIIFLSPFVFRYSRIIWIHLGYVLDQANAP
jgi:uncharacterized protein (DUF983 family)